MWDGLCWQANIAGSIGEPVVEYYYKENENLDMVQKP